MGMGWQRFRIATVRSEIETWDVSDPAISVIASAAKQSRGPGTTVQPVLPDCLVAPLLAVTSGFRIEKHCEFKAEGQGFFRSSRHARQ